LDIRISAWYLQIEQSLENGIAQWIYSSGFFAGAGG
jgi:hypothetical protein